MSVVSILHVIIILDFSIVQLGLNSMAISSQENAHKRLSIFFFVGLAISVVGTNPFHLRFFNCNSYHFTEQSVCSKSNFTTMSTAKFYTFQNSCTAMKEVQICSNLLNRDWFILKCFHQNSLKIRKQIHQCNICPGDSFKDTCELLNVWDLKIWPFYNIHIFQRMGKIFCVEFQRVPLKFYTKYLAHTPKAMHFIQT